MQEPTLSGGIEADIERLEVGLRQLKIQYDMFFAGSVPRQPYELRSELERIIRRHSHVTIRKYSQRFHFNALVSRYNSLSELWTKTLRSLEEGDRPAPPVADRAGGGEQVLTSCRFQSAEREAHSLRLLHSRFLEARRRAGQEDEVPYSSFLKGIISQTERLREKTGCESIELRIVVEDKKVRLKARPGR